MGAIINSSTTKYFKLTKNIDLTGRNWISIGNSVTSNMRAVIDGNFCSVINLTVNGCVGGLFRRLNGTVKNITFYNPNINGDSSACIADQLNGGTLDKIQVISGTINSTTIWGAGLLVIAAAGTTIDHCFFRGTVSAVPSKTTSSTYNFIKSRLLGIEDESSAYPIIQIISTYTAELTIKETPLIYLGGLVAINNGNIKNSYFSGDIKHSSIGLYNRTCTRAWADLSSGSQKKTAVISKKDVENLNFSKIIATAGQIPSKNIDFLPAWDYINWGVKLHFDEFFGKNNIPEAMRLNYLEKAFGVHDQKPIVHEEKNLPITEADFDSHKEWTNESENTKSNTTAICEGFGVANQGTTNCAYYSVSSTSTNPSGVTSKTIAGIKTPLDSSYAVSPYINDGFPVIKDFYWQFST